MATANESDQLPAPAGDAAEASAAIEAWLNERAAAPEPDYARVLSLIRQALAALLASDMVRRDDRAQSLAQRILTAQDIEDFAADVDLLSDRIAELTGRSVSSRRLTAVLNGSRLEQRPGMRRPADEDVGVPARMVFRL